MFWHIYYPDYSKVYPGEHISPKVLTALRQCDRKMKYMEYDLKVEQPIKDAAGEVVGYKPSREDSYERLLESDKQFVSDDCSMEEFVVAREEVDELHRCLSLLNADECALIEALFFEGITEREYGSRIGLSQKNVNKRKQRTLAKIKNLFIF